VATQFPQWASPDVRLVDSGSWDNEVFRLGDELAVRLPRRAMGALQVERQHRWLSLLGPRLPLPIPVPVAEGRPGEGYPWSWSVVPWFAGQIAALEPELDLAEAARGRGWVLDIGVRALAFGGPQDLLTKVGKHAMDELTIDAGTPIEWLDETPVTRPMPN